MNILCQFNAANSTLCTNSAEIVIRGASEDGKDLYVCGEHDLSCFRCRAQATSLCGYVNVKRPCDIPVCPRCSHDEEHSETKRAY